MRRALAITIAAIGALGTLALTPTVAVAADDPAPAVAPIDPVLTTGQDLVVRVSAGTTASTDLGVTVLVGARAVATRSALTQWLDGDGAPALTRVATATISAGSSSIDVTVPAADLPWSAASSGAMLLAADVDGADERIRSLVTLDLPGGGPTGVVLTMQTTTPETDTGLLTADELEAAVTDGGTLAQQLAVAQAGAALGLDPIVPASVAALGDDAPEEAAAWLEAAGALPQTYALPYGGADALALARAEVDVPGLEGIPTADGRLLPATLAEVPTSIAPIVDATSSSIDGELLGRVGASATVVLDTDDLDETLDRQTPSAHAVVGGVSVLAADAELQRLVRDAVTAGGTASIDATARTLALLATITREAPALQRTLVAALPVDADPTAALALQDAIGSVAWLTRADVATAIAQSPRSAELVASEPTRAEQEAAGRIAALVETDAAAETIAASLEDPAPLVAPVRLQLLAAVAATSRADDAAAVTRFVELVAPLRQPVTIVEGGDTALLGSPAELQVTLDNALDVDVTVLLTARPGTNAVSLPDEPVEVVVPATGRIRVPMPVDVVASGSGIIRLDVQTPTGVSLDSAVLRINAQPAFETILLVVVALAAALLLGFGILRSVRNRRAGVARGDIDPRTEQLAVADARDAAAAARRGETPADDRPGAHG
ncbi:hypothetical protein C1N71_14750 [Agrococcus sp. SGAir0287]|nr:hypothetical protein C1N71_14750 [Agrococcus sp. SGAir0287]